MQSIVDSFIIEKVYKEYLSMQTRQETDSFGTIEVASDRYWGAQTQRSLDNFKIGKEIGRAHV